MNNIFNEKNTIYEKSNNGVHYVKFNPLEKFNDKIKHCYTTRFGGVSEGECESLNFGFNRNDKRENILKNFELLSDALGIDYNNIVISNQTHDNKVKIITEEDKGKGIIRDSDIIGYDGLVTNIKNIPLATFYADCIPLYIYDNLKNVIGMVHSGWKSTFKEIAIVAVDIFKNVYGSDYSNIIVVMGPSIGKCCFEVGEDVRGKFKDKFGKEFITKDKDKYFVDLHNIIKSGLINKGLKYENIHLCNICTMCYKEYFFSYRGDLKKTGSQCAIMQLI